MARLRDIKVGMTVWIKKGRTKDSDFGLEDIAENYVGLETDVQRLDTSDGTCPVLISEDLWFPVDWISLTPPTNKTTAKRGKAGVETMADKPAPEKLYVAYLEGDWYGPETISGILKELEDGCYNVEKIVDDLVFYEVNKVSVEYTPAKFKVV